MNSPERKRPLGDYKVGYGRPPVGTRFQKGQSGNPSGQRRGTDRRRSQELLLKEAYRSVTVREGDQTVKMPALQAVMRSAIAVAAKGNVRGQRNLIEQVQAVEQERSIHGASASPEGPPMSEIESARAIAFLLAKAARERDKQEKDETKEEQPLFIEKSAALQQQRRRFRTSRFNYRRKRRNRLDSLCKESVAVLRRRRSIAFPGSCPAA